MKYKNRTILNYIACIFAMIVVRYGEPNWLQYLALGVCAINAFAFVWSIE